MALKEVSNIINNDNSKISSAPLDKGKGKRVNKPKETTVITTTNPASLTVNTAPILINEDEVVTSKEQTTPVHLPTSNNVVTPDTEGDDTNNLTVEATTTSMNVRRSLVLPPKPPKTAEKDVSNGVESLTNNFGKISLVAVPPNVKKVYKIVNNMTGRIGGNASGGAIYGELAVGSMQKVINLMKKHCDFNSSSRFIDVGCGLGKPNLHVAQDPGVAFSYGIEMERVRWMLGMHNLSHVLKAVQDEHKREIQNKEEDMTRMNYRCFLAPGDITEARCFDPFTHVYMFDIGFPPRLFKTLAEMFRNSQSKYLICYHSPRLMIDRYGFDIEFITKATTSMHGSGEGHSVYIYKRKSDIERTSSSEDDDCAKVKCDPLFKKGWDLVRIGLNPLSKEVQSQIDEEMKVGRPRRERRRPLQFSPSKDNSVLKMKTTNYR